MPGVARGYGARRLFTNQDEIDGAVIRDPPKIVLPARGAREPYRHARPAPRADSAAARAMPSRLLGRRMGSDRVVNEHEAHRPPPRSRLREFVPGPEEPCQRDGGSDKPDDRPGGQDPRCGSRRHHDEARDPDGQSDVPSSEGPDGHPPVSVVLQLRGFVDDRECSTIA